MRPTRFVTTGGDTIAVRRATPDDSAAIVAYVNQVSGQTDFLTFGPGEFGCSVEEQRSRLEKTSQADNELFLLAMTGSAIAGMIHFHSGDCPRTLHAGEFGMSVHRDYWGSGIGTGLLSALLDWARASGFVRKINLRVRTDNRAAIALYKKLGFVNQGTITWDHSVDGKFYDSHSMGQKINSYDC